MGGGVARRRGPGGAATRPKPPRLNHPGPNQSPRTRRRARPRRPRQSGQTFARKPPGAKGRRPAGGRTTHAARPKRPAVRACRGPSPPDRRTGDGPATSGSAGAGTGAGGLAGVVCVSACEPATHPSAPKKGVAGLRHSGMSAPTRPPAPGRPAVAAPRAPLAHAARPTIAAVLRSPRGPGLSPVPLRRPSSPILRLMLRAGSEAGAALGAPVPVPALPPPPPDDDFDGTLRLVDQLPPDRELPGGWRGWVGGGPGTWRLAAATLDGSAGGAARRPSGTHHPSHATHPLPSFS